ncbi:hypothetical protein [Streptomyces sp. NPDC003393]
MTIAEIRCATRDWAVKPTPRYAVSYGSRDTSYADPAQLANLLPAAFQGGSLLALVAHDVTPLKDALQAAIDHVRTFARQP